MADNAEAAEDLVHGRWFHVDDFRVHHHVRTMSVVLLEVLQVVLDDETAFPVIKPVDMRGVSGMVVRHVHALLPVIVA